MLVDVFKPVWVNFNPIGCKTVSLAMVFRKRTPRPTPKSAAMNSAWCKNYFPAEFMAAVLVNWGGYYSQRVYLSEARRMNLTVRPPHVNYAGSNFVVREADKQKILFMGLNQV